MEYLLFWRASNVLDSTALRLDNGDAVCVLDPLFGQGMSVAARQALVLRDFLKRTGGEAARRKWSRLRRDIVRHTNVPWLLTSSEAFRHPDTQGSRSAFFPVLQWYAAQVFELSASDPSVYRAFMGLMHLVKPLTSVFRHGVALPVFLHALQSGRSVRSVLPRVCIPHTPASQFAPIAGRRRFLARFQL